MTRLFIGSAPAHERPAGWTIVGMDRDAHLRLDVAHEALPLPTGSVDLVVLAHELHRVPAGSVAFLLGEVRRVLKPGGWRTSADGSNPFEGGLVRISVPDLSAACRAYVEARPEFFVDGTAGPTSAEPLSLRLVAWLTGPDALGRGMAHPFDHDSLLWCLKQQGFDGMYRSAYRKSLLPELRVDGIDRRPHDSLFVEAWKTRSAA